MPVSYEFRKDRDINYVITFRIKTREENHQSQSRSVIREQCCWCLVVIGDLAKPPGCFTVPRQNIQK